MFGQTESLPPGEFDRLVERTGGESNAATWVDWTYYRLSLPARDLAARHPARGRAHAAPRARARAGRGRARRRHQRAPRARRGRRRRLARRAADGARVHRAPVPLADDRLDGGHPRARRCPTSARSTGRGTRRTTRRSCASATSTRPRCSSSSRSHYGAIPPAQLPERRRASSSPSRRASASCARPSRSRPIACSSATRRPARTIPTGPTLEIVATLLAGCPSARLYRRLVIEREAASSVDAQLTPFRDPSLLRLAVTAARGHTRRRDPRDDRRASSPQMAEHAAAARRGREGQGDRRDRLLDLAGRRRRQGRGARPLRDRARRLPQGQRDRRAARRGDRRRRRARRAHATCAPERRTIVIAEPEAEPSDGDEADERRRPDVTPREPDRHRRGVARHAARLVRRRDPRRRVRRSARRRRPAPPRRAARAPRRRPPRSRRARRDARLASAPRSTSASSRDAVSVSGLALSRHLDAVVDLAADILAEPRFAEDEHARLLRETPQVLDEIRDDDSALATRWFDWLCCPGHAYGRTSLGTEASLDADRARRRDRAVAARGRRRQPRDRPRRRHRRGHAPRAIVAAAHRAPPRGAARHGVAREVPARDAAAAAA